MPENQTLVGGITENVMAENSQPAAANLPKMADKVSESIKNVVKTGLFLESLRNINWSRGYCWYAEMDGVPTPFNRGGVLGLPVKSVNFKIAEGTTYSFPVSTVETLEVPRAMGNLGIVTLDLLDDEQQTLARFFERWYNQIYNPYKGVLPVTEACKQITIYKQKSTRRHVKRIYYNIDSNVSDRIGIGFDHLTSGRLASETAGYDFLVFPAGPLQFNWSADANDLNTLSVSLTIAHFVNQDFGDPSLRNGVNYVGNKITSALHDGKAWLDKLANFI